MRLRVRADPEGPGRPGKPVSPAGFLSGRVTHLCYFHTHKCKARSKLRLVGLVNWKTSVNIQMREILLQNGYDFD